MSELSPSAKAFLNAHRRDGEPTPDDQEHVRAAIEASLVGVAAATNVGAGTWLSKLSLVKTGVFVMAVGVGVSVGVNVTALVIGRRTVQSAPTPARQVAVSPPPATPVPSTSVVEAKEPSGSAIELNEPSPRQVNTERPPVLRAAKEAPPAERSIPPELAPEAPSAVQLPAPVVGRPASPPPLVPATAEDEFLLVGRVQDLLQRGQPQAALETLLRWEAQFGASGQFAEEATAARVVALCQSGNVEQGRREATSHLAKYPASLQRNRIDRACETGDTSEGE